MFTNGQMVFYFRHQSLLLLQTAIRIQTIWKCDGVTCGCLLGTRCAHGCKLSFMPNASKLNEAWLANNYGIFLRAIR